MQALQPWLQRDDRHVAQLISLIKERGAYSAAKAELIVTLLQPLPTEALARPQTYQDLINNLDDESLVVRERACWHLERLVPEGTRTIKYFPTDDVEVRRKPIEQWRTLIPAGTIPPGLRLGLKAS